MIVQPTHEKPGRVNRSRVYFGPGFGRCSFECIGIGLGLGLAAPSASAPVPVNWSTVFPSTLFAIQSDLGITSSTTFTAADQSGNSKDFTSVTTGRPTMGTGPNGDPESVFDGSANQLTCATLNLPAPGTTPFFLFLIFRHITFVGSNPVVCGNAAALAAHLIYGVGGSPRLSANSGTDSAIPAAPPTIGSYECLEAYYSNTATDYLRRGSSSNTGIATGNNASTGYAIGGSGILTKANIGLLAAVGCSALPSGPQIAAARAKVIGMYGGTLIV